MILNKFCFQKHFDTYMCVYTHKPVSSTEPDWWRKRTPEPEHQIWVLALTFVIQVTTQDFEILVISKWFSLMSLPGLKNSMFPNPWARSPELLLSPSYSSSHFQQSHWSEGAPREQIQEGRGGITLAVRGSTKKRPISDGGRTWRKHLKIFFVFFYCKGIPRLRYHYRY